MADCSAWTEWNSPWPANSMLAPKYQVPLRPQAMAPTKNLEMGATEQAAASGSKARRRALSSSPVAAFRVATWSG